MANVSTYDNSAMLMDCQKGAGIYSKPFQNSEKACKKFPECDNRTYSAYATPGPYRGYYDDCFSSPNGKPACDLAVLYAPPITIENCWAKTCTKQGCNEDAHVACVVGEQMAKCNKGM